MKLILAFISLFSILGCSTYSKSQCENISWYDMGYRSALQGERQIDRVTHFQIECTQEHNVAINDKNFADGFNKGLEAFCSSEGGRNLGQTGGIYRGTCPKQAEEPFLKSYDSGRLDYLAKQVTELQSQVGKLRSEASSKDFEIQKLESEIRTLRLHRNCP